MPHDVDFPSGIVYNPADIYLSFGAFWEDDLGNRGSHPGLEAVGLLRPGATIDEARAELAGISAQLQTDHPDTNRDVAALVRDAITVIVGDVRGQLQTVALASLVLLLIACANLAGLTLTRAMSRQREMAVRSALGARRASLASLFLVEHSLLAAAGGAIGVTLAYGLTRLIRPFVGDLPRLADLAPDGRVLALSLGLMVGTTLAFSLAPMLWVRRATLDPWLRQRGATVGGLRLRHALVGTQVALAVVLLAAAVLLGASLRQLESSAGGIVSAGTLTFRLGLPDARYDEGARAPFFESLYARLAAGPGVTAVGGITTLPFSGSGAQSGIRPAGTTDADSVVRTDVAVVTRDYFRAMGVRLVKGRVFDERDSATSPRVAVVDERFAARFWPGADPIGRHVSGYGAHDLEVIGVVNHVDNYGVGVSSREELYTFLWQQPRTTLTTIVRTGADPADLAPFARATVASLDPSLAISSLRTMRAVVDRTVAGPRLASLLSGGFGACAMLLAAVGIYGLVAFTVALRRREAAVRMALGATPGGVVRAVVSGTAVAIALGSVAGVGGALLAGRLLASQLFGVAAHDPVVLGGTLLVLAAIALAASWIPARRAAAIPPAAVLQEE